MSRKKKPPAPPRLSESQLLQRSRNLACELARLAHDRHCRDIVVLELAGLSPVAYHFVIATGTSEQQIRSVAREMEDLGHQRDLAPFSRAGLRRGRWALIDFIDVVVHLFDEEFRRYYDLELLWGDAERVCWGRPESAA